MDDIGEERGEGGEGKRLLRAVQNAHRGILRRCAASSSSSSSPSHTHTDAEQHVIVLLGTADDAQAADHAEISLTPNRPSWTSLLLVARGAPLGVRIGIEQIVELGLVRKVDLDQPRGVLGRLVDQRRVADNLRDVGGGESRAREEEGEVSAALTMF